LLLVEKPGLRTGLFLNFKITTMIKVKWLKAHFKFAYSAGDIGYVTPEWAEKLLPGGYILPIPTSESERSSIGIPPAENPLPIDLPARDKLFAEGFDTLEKVEKAGDGLLDVMGISNNILKKINKYLKENK
jgi:hypothetical protein